MANVSQTLNTPAQTIKSSNDQTEKQTSNKSRKRSFNNYIVASVIVIPQILMNVGLGALKGLQVGTFKPGEFMNRQAKRIGTKDGKLSRFCGHVGTFAGVIVGIAVAVPSLLIGAACGLIKGIRKTPDAVKTCLDNGYPALVKQTVQSYNLDARKIVVIAATTFIIASTAFLLMPLALVSCTPLAFAFVATYPPLLAACGAALTYGVAQAMDEMNDKKATENDQAHDATEKDANDTNTEVDNPNIGDDEL